MPRMNGRITETILNFLLGKEPRKMRKKAFRIYFKGLLENFESKVFFWWDWVAICDLRGILLFEMRKSFYGTAMNRHCIEFKALVEGLNVAIALDLERVVFICDYFLIFQFVSPYILFYQLQFSMVF